MRIFSIAIRGLAFAGALTAAALVVPVCANGHPSFGGMHGGGMHAGIHSFGAMHGGFHGFGGLNTMHTTGWRGGWGHGGWRQHNWNWNGGGHWGHGHWHHGWHGMHRWRDGFGRWHWSEAVGAFALPFADYGYGGGGGYADDSYGGDNDYGDLPYGQEYGDSDYSGRDDEDGEYDRGGYAGGGCPCARDNAYGDADGGYD